MRHAIKAVVGLVTLFVLSANIQAAIVTAKTATYGVTTFAGDVDAAVHYAVLYQDDGWSLANLNSLFDGVDTLNTTQQNLTGTFDTDAEMIFFYQIKGDNDTDYSDELWIKDFGFTASSAGYFQDTVLTVVDNNDTDNDSLTLSTDDQATNIDPNSHNAGATISEVTYDKFGFGSNIGSGDTSALMYATYDVEGALNWYTDSSDNRLDGDGYTAASLPSPNPEPGSLALLGAAVAGFGGYRRFRRRRSTEQQPEDTEADAVATPEVD